MCVRNVSIFLIQLLTASHTGEKKRKKQRKRREEDRQCQRGQEKNQEKRLGWGGGGG